MSIFNPKTTLLALILCTFFCCPAQFTTITLSGTEQGEVMTMPTYNTNNKRDRASSAPENSKNIILIAPEQQVAETKSSQCFRTDLNSPKLRGTGLATDTTLLSLPFSIANLVEAMKRYRIKYPRIVLAQAIQETGWFRSNVCRTKNNLFGLTNPRTGEYFAFNHWSESVRAYATMVQYKYDKGNYYHWLEKIGYAGDPDYTTSLRKIVNRYL